jgi:hypothetical protein
MRTHLGNICRVFGGGVGWSDADIISVYIQLSAGEVARRGRGRGELGRIITAV